MTNKQFLIGYAIIWFCIGGLLTTFVTLQIQDNNIIKPYQQEIIRLVKDCRK